ncbi:MAG: Pvc16 family protein [Niveispirillum sp.]|uniref:Pvc16 family protein n=1 Tax=Niveispirillum sp. TaxID=1917217 RepID=UPI003BA62AF5
MLDRALSFVRDALDSHLQRSLSLSEPVAVLNHLHHSDSGSSQKNQNRLIMSLIKIEQDSSRQYYNAQLKKNATFSKLPPQFFNINVLMAANFDDYLESLKVLSQVILFFQANSSFQRASYPNLPEELNLLEIEVEATPDVKSFEIWGALGTSYVPSIIYKIRRLIVDSHQIAGFQTPLRQPVTEVGQ